MPAGEVGCPLDADGSLAAPMRVTGRGQWGGEGVGVGRRGWSLGEGERDTEREREEKKRNGDR